MTTAPLFDRLALDLAARSSGREGRATLTRFAEAGVDTTGYAGPLALALGCHCHAGDPWARITVTRLAALVPDDQVATLTVLLAMRPALLRLVRRLLGHGLGSDEAAALVVGEALEVLAEPSLAARTDVARWIVRDTWSRCWTQHRRDRRFASRWCDGPDGETALQSAMTTADTMTVTIAGEPGVESILRQGLRAGVLRPRHARLLYETRGLGRPVGEVAAEWGIDPGALTSMRRRAENRLRRHLLAGVADVGVGQ